MQNEGQSQALLAPISRHRRLGGCDSVGAVYVPCVAAGSAVPRASRYRRRDILAIHAAAFLLGSRDDIRHLAGGEGG